MMSEPVGFLGTGIMGSRMAGRLVAAGHPVVVWNRTRAKAEAVEGAKVVDVPRVLAEECAIVMMCLSDTPIVRNVVLGGDGLLEALGHGSVIVDHSTISPAATKDLAASVKARGAAWLDAPVSGGSEGAQRGTLSIMIGGDRAEVARVRPYLECLGTNIIHVGPVGSGQMAKLANQVLVAINQLAVSEALMLANAAGLDLNETLSAVEGGAGGSWMLSNRGPQMIARDWRPGFMLDLQQKDLRLVLETAEDLRVPMPGTALVNQLYRSLQARGMGAEGNHALVKALEALSGLELGSRPPR